MYKIPLRATLNGTGPDGKFIEEIAGTVADNGVLNIEGTYNDDATVESSDIDLGIGSQVTEAEYQAGTSLPISSAGHQRM